MPLDCLSANICLMVKEQVPLNCGTGSFWATQMRLTPREEYVMSNHYPLEERDPGCSPALHGHFQQLDHVAASPVVLPSSWTNHSCIACSLNHSLPSHLFARFPNFLVPVTAVCTTVAHREKLGYSRRWRLDSPPSARCVYFPDYPSSYRGDISA